MAKFVDKSAKARASIISQKMRDIGMEKTSIMLSSLHRHDALEETIAWNDVQAILARNALAEIHQLEVPSEATEGYNQHHHTSEFDGGLIPGVRGMHDHRDNKNGGFAFAVFHPATQVPQMPWEQ